MEGEEAKVIGGVPACRFHRGPGPILLEGDHREPYVRQVFSPGDIAQIEEAL